MAAYTCILGHGCLAVVACAAVLLSAPGSVHLLCGTCSGDGRHATLTLQRPNLHYSHIIAIITACVFEAPPSTSTWPDCTDPASISALVDHRVIVRGVRSKHIRVRPRRRRRPRVHALAERAAADVGLGAARRVHPVALGTSRNGVSRHAAAVLPLRVRARLALELGLVGAPAAAAGEADARGHDGQQDGERRKGAAEAHLELVCSARLILQQGPKTDAAAS